MVLFAIKFFARDDLGFYLLCGEFGFVLQMSEEFEDQKAISINTRIEMI
jgi:hypothetical protein